MSRETSRRSIDSDFMVHPIHKVSFRGFLPGRLLFFVPDYPGQDAVPVRRNNGFTLIELLAVVAILAVIAALLMPAIRRMVERGNAAKCMSNLKQIGGAVGMVTAENDGRLPTRLDSTGPDGTVMYLYPNLKIPPDGGVYHCPSSNERKTSSLGATLGSSGASGTSPGATPGVWSYGFNYGCGSNLPTPDGKNSLGLKMAQIPHPSKRVIAVDSNTARLTISLKSDIETRFAPRHRGSPMPSNKLGEAANFLFIDGHVESRVMSMNPFDQAEWDELGTNRGSCTMMQ